jgi:hypothetical protein
MVLGLYRLMLVRVLVRVRVRERCREIDYVYTCGCCEGCDESDVYLLRRVVILTRFFVLWLCRLLAFCLLIG